MATLKAVFGHWLADASILDLQCPSKSSNIVRQPIKIDAYIPPPLPFQPQWGMPDKLLTLNRQDPFLFGSSRAMHPDPYAHHSSSVQVVINSVTPSTLAHPNRYCPLCIYFRPHASYFLVFKKYAHVYMRRCDIMIVCLCLCVCARASSCSTCRHVCCVCVLVSACMHACGQAKHVVTLGVYVLSTQVYFLDYLKFKLCLTGSSSDHVRIIKTPAFQSSLRRTLRRVMSAPPFRKGPHP